MANFEAFRWNFSLSTNSEIGRSDFNAECLFIDFFKTFYFQSHQSNLPLSSKIEQLRAWLTTTNQFFESINLKKEQRRLSYVDYQQFKKELEAQETLYSHLKSQVCLHFVYSISRIMCFRQIDIWLFFIFVTNFSLC